LDVKHETSKIEFHTANLNLGNASLHVGDLKTEQVDSSREFDTKAERATLHFATPLPAGSKAQLRIAFDGPLTDALMGYYRSSYKVAGKEKYYSLTQFEVRGCSGSYLSWLMETR
jgi:aminopeptidase 2